MQMSSYERCRFNLYFHAICATAIILAFVVSGRTVLAVDGDLDPTFGTDGKVLTDFDHSTDIANAVAIQADGKLVVVGTAYQDNDFSDEDFAVARYNPDGTLDKAFGVGGKVQTDFPGLAAVASSVVVQPDGKIVVAGGAFPLFTFLGDFKVVRYNSNGSLDTSFGDGGIVTTTFPEGSYAFDVALQADGKIVAVGSANDPATFYDFAAVRYLSNGTLDATFGVAGKVHTDFGDQNFDRARSAALQPDGRIVAAGFAISQNGGVQNFAVARYTSNGVLDTTFSRDGKTQIDFGNCCQSANKVLLQSDGKIITVGYANTEDSDSDFLLARLSPRGSLDPTFGVGGEVRTSFGDLNGGANGAALQSDGKIVAVGFQANFTNQRANFALARYLDGQ